MKKSQNYIFEILLYRNYVNIANTFHPVLPNLKHLCYTTETMFGFGFWFMLVNKLLLLHQVSLQMKQNAVSSAVRRLNSYYNKEDTIQARLSLFSISII